MGSQPNNKDLSLISLYRGTYLPRLSTRTPLKRYMGLGFRKVLGYMYVQGFRGMYRV